MAQLTIYLDDDTIRRIKRAAREAKVSVSSWVKRTLTEAPKKGWPDAYFSIFGSLQKSDMERPPQPRFEDDSPRESF